MNKLLRTSLGLAACGAATLIAYAAVTYSPEEGGFVGKGDVQTVLEFNNAQMQANYEGVTFWYQVSGGYTFECEWWTGPDHNRTYHSNFATIEYGVGSTLAVTSTKKSTSSTNWTGWYLAPVATNGGAFPEPVDSDCGAAGNEMKTIVPGSIEPIGGAGGLIFKYDGVSYPLPNTPVI